MRISVSFLFLFFTLLTSTQDKAPLVGGTALVHNAVCDCTISIPNGWILDSSRTITDAPPIMLYMSKGTTKWHAIITVEAANKAVEGKNTLTNLLTWFSKVDSGSSNTITGVPNTTKDKKAVTVTSWIRPRQWLSHGCVGYVDEETHVAVITLMAQNKQDLETYLPTFAQVVESYSPVKSGVNK